MSGLEVEMPEKVKAPVDGEYASGKEAESEVEEILFWKVEKSVEESLPLALSEAKGRLKLIVCPEPVTSKSVPEVEVASITAPLDTC